MHTEGPGIWRRKRRKYQVWLRALPHIILIAGCLAIIISITGNVFGKESIPDEIVSNEMFSGEAIPESPVADTDDFHSIVIQRICIRLCQRCLHILAYFLHTHPVFLRQFPIYLPHAHRNLLRGKNYNRLFFLIISDNIIFFNQNKRYNRSFLPCTELKINTLGGDQNG